MKGVEKLYRITQGFGIRHNAELRQVTAEINAMMEEFRNKWKI